MAPFHPVQPDHHDPVGGGVDEPQPQAFVAFQRGRAWCDDGVDEVADTSAVGPVPHLVEFADERRLVGQPPVVDHHGQVVVHLRRLDLVDDEQPVEPARHLFGGAIVRVIPEGAGVGRREVVKEGAARIDRVLGQAGHPVHRVGDAQSVPMYSRRLRQFVHQLPGQPLAVAQPDFGTGHAAVVAPDFGFGIVAGHDPGLAGARGQRRHRSMCRP